MWWIEPSYVFLLLSKLLKKDFNKEMSRYVKYNILSRLSRLRTITVDMYMAIL